MNSDDPTNRILRLRGSSYVAFDSSRRGGSETTLTMYCVLPTTPPPSSRCSSIRACLTPSGPPGICSKATSIAACSESREVAVKRSSCAIVPPLRDPKILRGGPCATERSVARGSGLRLVKPEAMTTTVPIVEPILTSSSAVPQQPAQQGAISRLGPASGFVPAGWGLSGFGIRTARSRFRAGPQFHPGGLSRSRAVDPFSDHLPRQIRFHAATEPQLPQLGSRLPSK